MAYITALGDTAAAPTVVATVPTDYVGKIVAFIRQIAPLLLLVGIAYLIWRATRSKSARRNPVRYSNPKALGGWSRHQESSTRHRHLSVLVNDDGYATVARRLTLLKNLSRGAKRVVDADLDWLRETYGS